MRLIDADKLFQDCMTKNGTLAISQSQIANAPTFEDRDLFNMGYFEGKKIVERPKGKWIKINPEARGYAEFFRCSNCLSNIQMSYWMLECEYDYCPNCGAEMEVADNDKVD